MWIVFALVAALGSACTGLLLKRAIAPGGALLTTALFRMGTGALLALLVVALGGPPPLTPAYWRTAALVLVPEMVGMVCFTYALRLGELSVVQPLMGLTPVLTLVGGALLLREIPTPGAALGVAFVAAGVYAVGLAPGGSALAPLRAIARQKASWLAVAASLAWSMTSVLHRVGIREVGPFSWAVTLTFGSGLLLLLALPFVAWRTGGLDVPVRRRAWLGWLALLCLSFAIQQVGLHSALRLAFAGYVIALSSLSILAATALGIYVLGERSASRSKLTGAALVSSGAILIALFG